MTIADCKLRITDLLDWGYEDLGIEELKKCGNRRVGGLRN
ncbi:hypothetical protein D1AOALGA4SA_3717 [Olavius algarvensis Delta 1 endosymbiont]|nr:hypothetical protein D1AOALGA4SA_3717 [Olavius algarvensis Delta 1 endosymbiont]